MRNENIVHITGVKHGSPFVTIVYYDEYNGKVLRGFIFIFFIASEGKNIK